MKKEEFQIIITKGEEDDNGFGCNIQMIGYYQRKHLIIALARVLDDILESSTEKMMFLDCLVNHGEGFYHDMD